MTSPRLLLRVALGLALVASRPASAQVAQTSSAVATPKIRALVIGINRYDNVSIPDLRWAEDDAREMSALLRSRFGVEVEELLGRSATRPAIWDRLAKLKAGLTGRDSLLIFVAAHGRRLELPDGRGRGFIVPFGGSVGMRDGGDVTTWTREAVSMEALTDFAKEYPPQHVLIMADVCYSGFLGKRGVNDTSAAELFKRPSRIVITAGTEEQQAIESDDLKHGIFTYALLKVLARDEMQTVTDVFVRVRDLVASTSTMKMLPQRRDFAQFDGEFVFVPTGVGATESALRQLAVDQVGRSWRSTRQDVLRVLDAPNYRTAADAPGQERVWSRRFVELSANASFGDETAMAGLYYAYRNGVGTATDRVQAFGWARRAWETGAPIGAAVLASAYLNGVGVPANPAAADRLMREAQAAGEPLGEQLVANRALARYREDRNPSDLRLAIAGLERAAAAGSSSASAALAELIAETTPTAEVRMSAQLVAIITRAFATDSAIGKRLMAVLLARGGVGEARDLPRARQLLQQAADEGEVPAQNLLAQMLYQRHGFGCPFDAATCREVQTWGFPADVRRSFELATVLADQNIADGQYQLYFMFRYGDGVTPDVAKARTVLESAVTASYRPAIVSAGIEHMNGGGLYRQDLGAARVLFTQAELQGSADAAYFLGQTQALEDDALFASRFPGGQPASAVLRPMQAFRATSWNKVMAHWLRGANKGSELAQKAICGKIHERFGFALRAALTQAQTNGWTDDLDRLVGFSALGVTLGRTRAKGPLAAIPADQTGYDPEGYQWAVFHARTLLPSLSSVDEARVTAVVPGSAGEQAGLQVGDRLIRVGAPKPIENAGEANLNLMLGEIDGRSVEVELQRGTSVIKVTVKAPAS